MSADIYVQVFTLDKIFQLRGLSLVIIFHCMGSFIIVFVIYVYYKVLLKHWCDTPQSVCTEQF